MTAPTRPTMLEGSASRQPSRPPMRAVFLACAMIVATVHPVMANPANPATPASPASAAPPAAAPSPAAAKPASARTMGEILKTAPAADWRDLNPENVLQMELASGRVVIELAPAFAPNHAANIKALAREGYYDGLVILRSQDNFVVQWADPDEKTPKKVKQAKTSLKAEFTTLIRPDLPFNQHPDLDGYAPQTGFSGGFPSARDPKTGQAWLTHCYGTLGVGRGDDVDGASGTELYVVTGQSPRQLDRNITVVGRVVQGMHLLSTLPRGTGPLGFYENPAQHVPVKSIKVAADLPPGQRTPLQALRDDSPSFKAAVEALRNRGGDWYKVPAGHIDLCNVPPMVRVRPM